MSDFEWDVVQKILLVLLQVALPPLLAWLGVLLRRWISGQESKQWFEVMTTAVRDAVSAAEQLGLTDQLKDLANSKMEYAIQYVEDVLKANGFNVEVDEIAEVIRGMIEAEVNRQFPPSLPVKE